MLGRVTVEPGRQVYPLSALTAGALCQEPRRAGRRGRACVSADRRAGPQPRHQRRRRYRCNRLRKIAPTPARRKRSSAYDRRRRPDILARTAAVNLLNMSLLSDMLPAQLARSAGLGVLGALRAVAGASSCARACSRAAASPGCSPSLREQIRR